MSSPPSVSGSAPADDDPPEKARFLPLDALLSEWETDAARRADARVTGKALGPVTGFPRLDRDLGGYLSPGLHIVHGVPGVGKTAFALQVAGSCGCPCLFVTCEMSPLELLRRITARLTATFLGKLKTGEISAAASLELARAAVCLTANVTMLDATVAPASPAQILTSAQVTRRRDETCPHLIIVIDSVHSWAETAFAGMQEYEALNRGLTELREIAALLKCPILCVAERNREKMTGGGLSAGAGSRKIEYGAETVIDMNTKAGEKEDANGEKAITIRVAKNRNGATTDGNNFKFHGALQRQAETL